VGRYVIRRLLQMILVLFGTTFIIYWLVWSLPGDPFAAKCGDRPCPPAVIERLHQQFNLGDPLIVQYGKYMAKIFTGDFGVTFQQTSVAETIARTYPVTLRLAILALIIDFVIGISAGVLSGLRRGGFLDNLVLVSSLLAISIPVFVLGYVVQLVFGVNLGLISPAVSAEARWSELIAPAFIIASLSTAFVSRITRSSIAENSRADSVRTATAKGMTRGRVVGVHLLRNSLIPVITYLGLDFGSFLGGAIVTEGIFNINGVGGTLFRALGRHDATMVVPLVILIVLAYLLVNLLVDIAYGVLDPRIRYD
jgi:oligopeptide transport system permease protein